MRPCDDAARTDGQTIDISVFLSAALRRGRPGVSDGLEHHVVPAGATVADLLTAVGIEAGIDLTAAVDGELAERDTPLHDGAEVVLLVPMEGGAAAEAGGAAAEGEATIRNAVKGFCSKP